MEVNDYLKNEADRYAGLVKEYTKKASDTTLKANERNFCLESLQQFKGSHHAITSLQDMIAKGKLKGIDKNAK